MKSRGNTSAAVLAIIVVIVVILGFASCTTVQAGHVGIVDTFGDVEDRGLPPGVHGLNPLARVHDMDCRVQHDKGTQSAASKDMQDVKVELGLNYHLLPDRAPSVYKTVGFDWAKTIIPNAESETLKAEIAHHNASDILDKRVEIKVAVEKALSAWLLKYGISLDEVSISNISFSGDYEAAIEKKQVEEQTVLRKAYELQTAGKDAEIAKAKASGEAQAAIEKAKGEAEAITVRANAQAAANERLGASLTPAVLAIQQIERWDGKLPTTLAREGSPLILGAK